VVENPGSLESLICVIENPGSLESLICVVENPANLESQKGSMTEALDTQIIDGKDQVERLE
jgi:hypothetical protein